MYTTEIKKLPVQKCSFAFAGTFGHECGAPAVLVGVQKVSDENTGNGRWVDGVYYAGRCSQCATIKGGENAEYGGRFEPLDHSKHINRIQRVVWSPDGQ